MTLTVRNLLGSKVKSYFDTNVRYFGVLLNASEALVKYEFFQYFESRYSNSDISRLCRLEKNCHR